MTGKLGTGELVLVGRNKAQLREASPQSITEEQIETFFSELAEANNGGAMVASVLNAAEVGVRVKLVHASRGKAARAEPIALRFESGRAFLAGSFPQLEDELAGLTTGGRYEGPSRSPDRADAMVWAMTELSETRSGVPRVRML